MASHGTTTTCVVHNVGHAGIAGDNATNFCECINECDVTDFDTVLSSGRMSPKVILENIGNSSDIPARFINATETRNRVDTSLMMHSVRLLTGVAEAHRRMRFHVNMDFVDAGTSWTRAVSRLLGNLNEMVQGHVDDSFGLLGTLDYVYSRHVDYLATSLSSLLQECDVLTAGVRMIAISAQSRSTRSEEDHLAGLLHDKLRYLKNMLNDFDNLLKKEPQKSTYSMEYFPNPLNAKNCALVFRKCKDILPEKIESLETIIDKIVPGTILKPTEAVSFTDVTDFRQILSYLSWCLLSYKDEVLDGFRSNLVASRSSTQSTDFDYEIPSSSLLKFNEDDDWLESISSRYITSSLSKHTLATALHANGSEVLSNADRLYTDIDTSLFSDASDLIDASEKHMSSFYIDLVQQVNTIQVYMYPDTTALEWFLRNLSIWRVPVVNFQKSQVAYCCFLLLCELKLYVLHETSDRSCDKCTVN